MIADLEPYSEYRESGLPWVGQVPKHWTLAPNRAMLRRRKVLVGKRHSDYKLLSLTRSGVIVRDISTGKGKFSADMGTSQEVRNGDLVFCLFDVPETPRTVGLSRFDGMITGAYTVFECSDSLLAAYLDSFYRAMDDRKLLSPLYSGLRNTIPPPRFLGTKTPMPPPDEQAAIVRFLNHTNQRIERTIRAKRKVIALLNEQKQIIIHRAVTRGLDPNVRLKQSGIPWLGEIPEVWETRPLKQLLLKMDYGTSDNVRGEGKIRVLTMGHIKEGKVSMPVRGGLYSMPIGLRLETNDLLFNRTNSPDLVGKVGLFRGEAADEVTFASYLVRLRARPEHNSFWLNYLLNSTQFWTYARSQALVSLHQANLNSKRYGQMILPVPPKEEQDSLTENISISCCEIEQVINRTEREINLLREYRTRLIADVVTGKLDVREAAARLPDETDSTDSTDNLVDTDDMEDPCLIEGEDDGNTSAS
jgi:type I restriction enzyme S subunit